MNEKNLRQAMAVLDSDESGDEGLDAARELCRWFLGDSNWADEVLLAYLDPAAARQRVKAARDA